jgi:hypothetical protein
MHHSEWSPKPFFRHLSPPALEELSSWARAELRPLGAGKPWEQWYRAWVALPAHVRQRLESALLPVNDLSCAEARSTLETLAASTWGNSALLKETFSWSTQDLALRLFLAAPVAFAQLHQGWLVDSLEHLKEYAGRYPLRPKPSERAKAELREAMRHYLWQTAFGPKCHVEDFANDEKFAVFVFHEDELKPKDRFLEGETLEAVWDRDVVRLAAVFHYETNVLMVKAPRKQEREKLRDLFAECIMKDPLYFLDARVRPRFSFEPLKDPGFVFPPLPGSQLVSVGVQRVVVRPVDSDVRRLTLDFREPLTTSRALEGLATFGVDVRRDIIDGVNLRFTFEGIGRSRTRTVSLFNPNSSNLSDTPRDRIIRRHLKRWGFDANAVHAAVGPAPLEALAH